MADLREPAQKIDWLCVLFWFSFLGSFTFLGFILGWVMNG